MNRIRTEIGRMAFLYARLTVLIAGGVCLLCFPWDTPLVAGHVGCLILGVRVWVIGLALLVTAAIWVPDESVQPGV